jgi:PKD repeat protein
LPQLASRSRARCALAAGALTVALTFAADAAHAAGPEASFAVGPEGPVAGQTIVFTDTSTGFSDGAPLQRDWDLDADGAYDDASGPTASRSYRRVLMT